MKQQTIFEKKLFESLDRLGKQRHLHAVKGGFVYLMPIMIAGSVAVLINNFPLNIYQSFMESLFGEGWRNFGSYLWSATFAIISMSATITISASLASWYKTNRQVEISESQCSLIALSCLLVASYPDGGFISTSMAGSTGLFVAIAISLVSTELIIFIKRKVNIRAFMFVNEPDGRIANAFSAMLPSFIVLLLFAFLRLAIKVFDLKPLNDMVYDIFQMPFNNLGNNLFSAVLFNISTNFMWIFGIHGNNVLDNVANNIFLPAVFENQAAVIAGLLPPNIFSKTFFDTFVYMGGAGTTLCLIIALLLFARRSSQNRLAKISLVPGIFNINEMLMYGLPIILNPVYMIPFVLAPLAMLLVSTAATYLGLVPHAYVEVSWTAPVLISGYTATGNSWAGALLQLFNITLGVMIYRPFVLLSERMRIRRFQATYKSLCKVCEDDYSHTQGLKLMNRGDDIGSVARLLSFDLEKAINENNIVYYYQPITDGSSGAVSGAEALIRWNHPEYGFISPMVIVAIAEDMGLIGRLGRLALSSACAELKKWRETGNDIYVSVNFSATELKNHNFADEIAATADSYGLPPTALKIEVTESLAINNDEVTNGNITKLAKMGFGIAIDDFGMGHSSLVYIRRFPVSMLKVDKALSKDISTVPENLEIINSIHLLCKSLGIQMVVEYVENEEQLALLNGIGCGLYQGYHYSRPLPPDEFYEYLRHHTGS